MRRIDVAQLRDYTRHLAGLHGQHQVSWLAFARGVFEHQLLHQRNIWIGSPTTIVGADRILVGAGSTLRVGIGDFGLTTVHDHTLIRVNPGGRFLIDGTVSLQRGVRIVIDDGELRIGQNTNINGLTNILVGYGVEIGADCTLSWNVQILDHDFHTLVVNGEPQIEGAPVTIGDRVWIGTDVTILKGVSIGDDSVIAAGSVVTRDVAANTVAAGVPARPVATVDGWGNPGSSRQAIAHLAAGVEYPKRNDRRGRTIMTRASPDTQ